MMVSSPSKCPGVEAKVCNRSLPSKENDPHHLGDSCLGNSCRSDDHCVECHDWSDDRCNCLANYMAKLSLHREKKCERKAKAFSSSFSGFLLSMPVPLCQLPSSVGTSVVTTTPSSAMCVATFSVAAPLVPPVDVTPVEQSRKLHCVDSQLLTLLR